MKRYDDYKDIKDVQWTKYKIIVPTSEDKKELMEAFKHIHDSDIDTDNIAVNQLAHEYRDVEEDSKNNIIVDKKIYDNLEKTCAEGTDAQNKSDLDRMLVFAEGCMLKLLSKQPHDSQYPSIAWTDIMKIKSILKEYKTK